ncbi:MAG: F0F1 ATP synthase subunit delta [Micromonosporaceae bacterium]|nr:F0F1 ATP synthase subunit delta [Micromonosporaceae bacterium]
MRAASRQSYAAGLEWLDGYAGDASPEQLRAVAEELLATAGLLAREVRLRRALSDPARAGADRAALLRGLLGDRVGEATRELLDTLVAGRWSAPSELLDGCEQLGVQALLASSDRAGALAEVEDELFRFGQVVSGDRELASAVGDRGVPVERRGGLTDQLLSGATEITARLVRVALGGFGGRSVAGALTRLVELAAERRNRSVAYITVATPLSEVAEQRLGAALSARYRRDVSVKTTVDPRVLGGARVQIGADLYDGTVAHRLAQARTALATG